VTVYPPPFQPSELALEEAIAAALSVRRRPDERVLPPWNHVSPAAIVSERRMDDRLGWLAVLAHPNARRTPGLVEDAIRAWTRWLATDRPGRGPAWFHTTDVAARVLHAVLALSGFGPRADADLRRRIAGSMAFHLDHLEARLSPSVAGDPRRLLQLCGLVAGTLAWPLLPRSSRRLYDALTALGREAHARILVDGACDLPSPSMAAEVAFHLLVVRTLVRGANAGLPASIERALSGLLPFLEAVSDADGRLLPIGPVQPVRLLPLTRRGCVPLLRQIARAQDLSWEPPGDPVFYPEGGVAVGQGLTVASARGTPLALSWSPLGSPVLAIPADPARFVDLGLGRAADVALVEGAARLLDVSRLGATFRVRGACAGPAWTWRRTAQVDGRRLVVVDAVTGRRPMTVSLAYSLAPGWEAGMTGATRVRASRGPVSLEIALEPSLTWSVETGRVRVASRFDAVDPGETAEAAVVVGRGRVEPGQSLGCTFQTGE